MSKIAIIEHLTHKSGKFVFSNSFDDSLVGDKLKEADLLYLTIHELPILPHMASQMREEFIRRSIFGTAAIEGNALSEDEVGLILAGDGSRPLRTRSELEIANLKSVYSLLNGRSSDAVWEITEKLVRSVHKTLTIGIDYYHNSPGKYRNELVKVGNPDHGGTYTPPKTLDDIQTLMKMFVEWINGPEVKAAHPIVRAGLAHLHLAKIHPFQDGNGRTARFVEAVILDKAGIKYLPEMLSNFYYKNIDEYFIAFSSTHKTKTRADVTPFMDFYLDAVVSSLKEIKEKVTIHIRLMALRNFYYLQKREKRLSQRQRDLLLACLDTWLIFKLSDLFSHSVLKLLYGKVSESTARRDLKKLLAEGYLVYDSEAERYQVNLRMLG